MVLVKKFRVPRLFRYDDPYHIRVEARLTNGTIPHIWRVALPYKQSSPGQNPFTVGG